MRVREVLSLAVGVLLGLTMIGASPARGADADEALLKALPKSKHSLADGIKQVTKGSEVAISAKFELEKGELMLSVYTAEKGLEQDAEHNVLKEFNGSATGKEWKPEIEVFKDVAHVARSAEQLTVVASSKMSLLDVIKKAEKQQPGTVFSVTPTVRKGKSVYVVLVASEGKAVELSFDVDSK
jgi:uncharacterized membrane protein YkoI